MPLVMTDGLDFQPTGEELIELLSPLSTCSPTLCEERHHMATYVGPRFGKRERLMFIGLDHGEDCGGCIDLKQRREDIISCRKGDWIWNQHYWGCVRTAALLFGLTDCIERCRRSCAGNASNDPKTPEDCSVLHFIQANSVKDVPKGKRLMKWEQAHLILDAFPLLLDEIRLIRPTVIIVHGVNNRKTLQPVFGAYLKMTPREHFGKLTLGGLDGFSAYVAFFRHPSRGWLGKDWPKVIEPTISKIVLELSRDQR